MFLQPISIALNSEVPKHEDLALETVNSALEYIKNGYSKEKRSKGTLKKDLTK